VNDQHTIHSALILAARSVLLLAAVAAGGAAHASRCSDLIAAFGTELADVQCFESTDLTTNNPATTPLDNALTPPLPAFAFTPRTDRATIAPGLASQRTPITKAVPGLQLDARIASDPTGEARFLLRLPDDWNGRLVVAGASGTRSEFNGDFAWSDYVVQKGYAYASQNKGVLNLRLTSVTGAGGPSDCRLNPSSPVFVHFYDNDPGQQFTRWRHYMIAAAKLARQGLEARYSKGPKYTYAVGTSNGGYQVRRAIETAPDLFDGGVDWEGTFVDHNAPNLLTDLPAGVLNLPDYVSSGYDPKSTAAKNIRAAGYPPDLPITPTSSGLSLWGTYSEAFWEVTFCQWQKRLDPTYNTYVDGTGTYNYVARLSVSDVGDRLSDFATTGAIQRPLITIAGTMDGLLPIDHHARAYARKVRSAADDNAPPYRLYEVQNGNHIEAYDLKFPQLELIEPHAQHAFDLLVQHVESGASLPPDQCIPRGGQIADAPAQPGHCAALLAP
jgi:3HB-oligomer hydrolase (3HBOH)